MVVDCPRQTAGVGLVVIGPIVGQIEQPPGPSRTKDVVFEQPLAAVTVTLNNPTGRLIWFWLVGLTLGPVHANV